MTTRQQRLGDFDGHGEATDSLSRRCLRSEADFAAEVSDQRDEAAETIS